MHLVLSPLGSGCLVQPPLSVASVVSVATYQGKRTYTQNHRSAKVTAQTARKRTRYITAQVGVPPCIKSSKGTLSVAHQVTVHCIRQCCRVAQEYGAVHHRQEGQVKSACVQAASSLLRAESQRSAVLSCKPTAQGGGAYSQVGCVQPQALK